MPSYTRGIPRDKLVFVQIQADAQVYYGFDQKDFSGVPGGGISRATIESELGHLASAPDNAIKMYRANSPKPARVRKVINRKPGVTQQGSISSYCAGGNIVSAQTSGWKLVKGARRTSLSNNSRTVTALATLSDGSVYAFPMNKADFDAYRTELGLDSPATMTITSSTDKWGIVRGSSYPKAGTASKTLPDGSVVSSFFSTDNEDAARQAGWQIDSEEVVI